MLTTVVVLLALLTFGQTSQAINQAYRLLGLQPGASKPDIKKAFKELSLKYHPDQNPTHKEHYQNIIEAYERLKGAEEQENSWPTKQQRVYVQFQDLMNQVEYQVFKQHMHSAHNQSNNTTRTVQQPPGFVSWCLSNPKIIFAAFCLSLGLVLICK